MAVTHKTPDVDVAEALSRDAAAALSTRFRDKMRKTIAKALGDAADSTPDAKKQALFYYCLRAAHARHKVNTGLLEQVTGLDEEGILSAARQFPKAYPMEEATSLIRNAGGKHATRHGHMFAPGEWRRYYPMPAPKAENLGDRAKNIIAWLELEGFTDIDYIAGTCVDDRKQTRKIGRCLPNERMKSEFANDPERQGGNLMFVISRHPYDLIRMSTQRGWESCMTRNGMYFEYVPKEVREGSMVAYLISKNDPEIQDPMSRVTLKPFRNKKRGTVMQVGPTYGMGSDLFKDAVQAVLDREYNAGLFGEFNLSEDVYSDGLGKSIRRPPPGIETWEADKWLDYLDVEVSEEPDGRKVITGDMDLSDYNLTRLPDFSGYELEGNLNLNANKLTDLKGCPSRVSGRLNARECQLTSLEGAPSYVGESVDVSRNKLTSLKGGPGQVGQSYLATENQLTSLEGAPQTITASFNVRNNRLTSLKNGPKAVVELLDVSANQIETFDYVPKIGTSDRAGEFRAKNNRLTSLEGLEGRLMGSLSVTDNPTLTSLKGCPSILKGQLFADRCGLTTLEGGPNRVEGNYLVRSNKLKTLKGAAKVISGMLDASENALDSLVGMPAKAESGIRLHNCGLTSLEGVPKEVTCDLDLTDNRLTTLAGGPERVEGRLMVIRNRLTTLEGMPQVVTHGFHATSNQLTSLKGISRQIGRDIGLGDNQITSLEGLQRKVEGDLWVNGNRLTSIDDLPEEIGGELVLRGNRIEDATLLPKRVRHMVDLRDNPLRHLPDTMPERCRTILTDRWHVRDYQLPSANYPPNPEARRVRRNDDGSPRRWFNLGGLFR
ncbi:MAG: hypothetical protein Alpg2KO_06700 [Alphaproteobacteria bacterium]